MANPLADSEWQSLPVHDHTTLCEVTNRSIDPGERGIMPVLPSVTTRD